jgi:hypothetical protein
MSASYTCLPSNGFASLLLCTKFYDHCVCVHYVGRNRKLCFESRWRLPGILLLCSGKLRVSVDMSSNLVCIAGLVQSLKNATLPQISFTVSLLDTMLGGQHVSLHFRFPRKYPELEALSVRVDCSGDVGRRKHQQISCALQMHAEQLVGQESVLEILQRVRVSSAYTRRIPNGCNSDLLNERCELCL